MSHPEWKKQLPMYATYSRMLVAPIVVYLLYGENPSAGWWATGFFIAASITDFLDGYWARIYQAESAMGKFMDPIADKILVLCSLIMLLHLQRVDPIMVMLLLGRDIFIGGLRSVAATNNVVIAAKAFGKWKTGVQMVALPFLFVNDVYFGVSFGTVGYYGLWISVILSLFSGAQYCWGYYKGRQVHGVS